MPICPLTLAAADLEPIERGQLYNRLDICPLQRACVEEALRLVAAEAYPRGAGEAVPDAAQHLLREREQREELQRPPRPGGAG